jgi:hypothetical protein
MQTASSDFTDRTQADVRPVAWRMLASFQKNFDEDIDFFTIGTSTIGGTDILKGSSDVVQEWDKYDYEDFSDRVMQVEYTRSAEIPTSPLTLATADITLDNHDGLFTPGNVNSAYVDYLVPNRPIKIHLGFKNEFVPIFVGLTKGLPDIDESAKTVRFHAQDFLSSILNRPLPSDVIYLDYRIDEIISALLQAIGLTTSQFDLDVATTVVPFFYGPKDMKLGAALRDLAQAELGNIRMDEGGVIRFENHSSWNSHSKVWDLTENEVKDISSPTDQGIINAVEVYARPRAVADNQIIWTLSGATLIPAGDSLTLFANFQDDFGVLPVVGVDTPVDTVPGPGETSTYQTNTAIDGSGTSGTVTFTSFDVFSTAAKLVFTNTGGADVYLTALELWGEPAKVTNDISVRVTDDMSIGTGDGFDEQPFEIRNDYIQSSSDARTIGLLVLADRAQVSSQKTMLMKGVPQAQIGDIFGYTDRNVSDDAYFLTEINGILSTNGFTQTVKMSKRSIQTYMQIGISLIGGDDKIGP